MFIDEKKELKSRLIPVLAERVRSLMAKEDLTSEMLSEFSGISRPVIREIRGGERSPNLTTICMIAKVLRVTIDELVPPEVYK